MTTPTPPRRRPGGTRRQRRALRRVFRGYLAVVVVVLLAVSLPGADHSGQIHELRTQLADARAALRTASAAAAGAPAAEAFGGGSGGFASAGHGAVEDSRYARWRVEVAERQVATLEREVEAALARAGGNGFVTGVVEQVRSLLARQRDPQTAGRLRTPVRGVVTSGFGPRRLPSFGADHMHEGIDIFAPGGTPVRAAADGKVTFAGYRPESGLSVTISHGPDERGRALHTVYSHLSSIDVHDGQRVSGGEHLGAVGNTGSHSTGPHLHFEVRLEGQAVDPRAWL